MLNTLRATYNNKDYILVQDVMIRDFNESIEAEIVIKDTMKKFGVISYADLYDIAIIYGTDPRDMEKPDYTYRKYGFKYIDEQQIKDITFVKTTVGYMLAFPLCNSITY